MLDATRAKLCLSCNALWEEGNTCPRCGDDLGWMHLHRILMLPQSRLDVHKMLLVEKEMRHAALPR